MYLQQIFISSIFLYVYRFDRMHIQSINDYRTMKHPKDHIELTDTHFRYLF